MKFLLLSKRVPKILHCNYIHVFQYCTHNFELFTGKVLYKLVQCKTKHFSLNISRILRVFDSNNAVLK